MFHLPVAVASVYVFVSLIRYQQSPFPREQTESIETQQSKGRARSRKIRVSESEKEIWYLAAWSQHSFASSKQSEARQSARLLKILFILTTKTAIFQSCDDYTRQYSIRFVANRVMTKVFLMSDRFCKFTSSP